MKRAWPLVAFIPFALVAALIAAWPAQSNTGVLPSPPPMRHIRKRCEFSGVALIEVQTIGKEANGAMQVQGPIALGKCQEIPQ